VTHTIESHEFAARDFIGGDAALDFINTVTGRDQQPRDWLDSYARLLARRPAPSGARELSTVVLLFNGFNNSRARLASCCCDPPNLPMPWLWPAYTCTRGRSRIANSFPTNTSIT
jgi:hypothetical protein